MYYTLPNTRKKQNLNTNNTRPAMFPPLFSAPPSSSSLITTATLYTQQLYRYTISQDFAITLTHTASIPNAHVLDYLCYAIPFFSMYTHPWASPFTQSCDSLLWSSFVTRRDCNWMKTSQERYRFAEQCFLLLLLACRGGK